MSRGARPRSIARATVVMVAALVPAVCAAAAELLPDGADFPAWQLTDHTGAERSSAELAGQRYLLWFYPKAMTPG